MNLTYTVEYHPCLSKSKLHAEFNSQANVRNVCVDPLLLPRRLNTRMRPRSLPFLTTLTSKLAEIYEDT